MTSPTGNTTSYLAEQLVGINTKITNIQAQRVAYVAGTVSSIDIAGSTFGADVLQPDGTTSTVTGIRSSPQFLPAVGNVVTLALSGAQIIYQPYGVAGGSIDTPQLSTAVNTNISSAATSATSAQASATAAQTSADAAAAAAVGKITTFYAGLAPTSGMNTGDLWINTGSNNTLYRYSGSSWVQIQDAQIQAALTNAATAQSTADGKIVTFYSSTTPTATDVGDFWVNTGSGNQLYRWSGSAWVSVQDASIAAALTAANNAAAIANTKVLVFAQSTTPTASEVGDIWFNTGDGMKMYIWGPTPTVTRINYALNPSFEADAAGTLSPITGWNNYASGSTGTVTRSIVTTGGVTQGTKAAQIVSASQAITAGVGAGVQQSYVAAAGDVWRFSCSVQLAVTDTNKVPRMLVEWLDSSNTVLGSGTSSGSGTLTTSQTLVNTTAALPSGTASIRVTIFRRSNGSGSTLTNADLVIDAVLAERNRDTAAPTTYFDGGTLVNNDSQWGNPNTAPNSISTIWQPGVTGVNAWQRQQLRNDAIQPQSILGNNCIAYGSITAPLLEALLVLTGTVVAGDPNTDHAALMTDGVHLYRTILGEGVQEVGRFAVGSIGTLMQWVDSTGKSVAIVDEGGEASFTGLNVDTDPVFQGTALTDLVDTRGGFMVASSFNGNLAFTGITTTFGLGEISFYQDNSRSYKYVCRLPHIYTNTGTTRALLTLRYTTDGSAPTTTSPVFESVFFSMVNSNYAYSPPDLVAYGNFTGIADGSLIRVLVCAKAYDGAGNVNFNTYTGFEYYRPFRLFIEDVGPNIPDTYLANTGGGGVVAKTTHDTGWIGPSGYWSYRGSGSLRSDTTDVVQGTDPSGFNGDGKGGWNFSIPNISGTVNWVKLYIYNNWSYYNSGGKAIVRLVTTANSASPSALSANWAPTNTFPKPGPVTLTLPASFNSVFTGRTSIGLYLGPSSLIGAAGNETYYIRADGPSAKLEINYTQ